jgi:hypothetical protein
MLDLLVAHRAYALGLTILLEAGKPMAFASCYRLGTVAEIIEGRCVREQDEA